MKIGIDARSLSSPKPTGVGLYLLNILQQLEALEREKKSKNKFYLYSNKDFAQGDDLDKEIFTKVVVPFKIGSLWPYVRLKKIVKKSDLDVFWGPQHVLPKKVRGVKYLLTVHDIALLINPAWGSFVNNFQFKHFVKSSVKRADKIIAVSNATKNDLVTVLNCDPNKIDVIYNGVNRETFVDNPDELYDKFKIAGKYFLYLGTIEPRKNIANIVKAYNEYRAAHADRSELLVLAGGLGWKYEPILDTINSSPYKNDIKMVGYLNKEEKNLFYKNASAFLFPSYYEGFGIPIAEAMQWGVPVITSNSSSLPEVAGDVGYYIDDCDDYKQLSSLMDKVYSLSESELIDIKDKSIKHSKQFSWKTNAEKVLNCIENLSCVGK